MGTKKKTHLLVIVVTLLLYLNEKDIRWAITSLFRLQFLHLQSKKMVCTKTEKGSWKSNECIAEFNYFDSIVCVVISHLDV